MLQLLQCCSSKIDYVIVKINSIFIYINIGIFFGYRKCFSRTATLQHCNSECQALELCRAPAVVDKVYTAQREQGATSHRTKFFEKYSGAFVDRNGNVVPLQMEMRNEFLRKLKTRKICYRRMKKNFRSIELN